MMVAQKMMGVVHKMMKIQKNVESGGNTKNAENDKKGGSAENDKKGGSALRSAPT